MVRERDIYTINIVLLGNFNPVIITPFWLANKGIIRDEEAEYAKVEVIHPHISKFNISDWLTIEVTQERIDFKTNKESHFTVLRDLIVSVFSNLSETPIRAFGINHHSHFSCSDQDEYEKLGYWLSPVQIFDDLIHQPKLQSIQFKETLNEGKEGNITITISPSDLILDRKSVIFNINHHYNGKSDDSDYILNLLVKNWNYSFDLINKLNNRIWQKAKI